VAEVKDFWTILKDYGKIKDFLIESVRIVQDSLALWLCHHLLKLNTYTLSFFLLTVCSKIWEGALQINQSNKQTIIRFRLRRQLLKIFFYFAARFRFLHWSTDHLLLNLILSVNELYGMVVPTYFDHPVIKEYILKYNQK